jgi:DNA repair protein RecO (recombination protein O)
LATSKRISDEPAFVLHRYDWSESSLILEVFTRHHGRIAMVAKGAKRPSSNFRPVLLPLQPLHLAFGGEAEIRTLKGAEWVGGQVMPTGEALLSGYYLNELLLRLLARDDPHPQLFDAYAAAVAVLASEHGEALEPALRAFELLLLREIGLLPALDVQTLTLAPLDADAPYTLVAEAGLIAVDDEDERPRLTGARWRALQRSLDDAAPFHATLREAAADMAELKPMLRTLLHYHCGVGSLRTRQMLVDLQSL